MVDVLILNYNSADTTISLLKSIHRYKNIRNILVVDNKSTDDSLKIIRDEHIENKIHVISSDKNGGYGYGNNWGFRYLKEHFNSNLVLLCNPDTRIDEEVISRLEDFLLNHSNYLAVAPFMLNANKERDYLTAYKIPSKLDYILSMEFVLGKFVSRCHYPISLLNSSSPIDVETVAGSLFMINLSLCPSPQIYDENMFLYCEETVFGLYAKQHNFRICLLPDVFFLHEHSVSISKSFTKEHNRRALLFKSRIYLLKHYYNANVLEITLASLLSYINYFELFIKNLFRR